MRGKILFAAGMAVGYVLGTRAGRERYEELREAAKGFWNDPRVQHRFDQVEDFVKEKVPEVAEFVSDGAKKVVGQVTGSGRTKKPATKAAAKKPAAKKPATKTATKPSGAASSGSSS